MNRIRLVIALAIAALAAGAALAFAQSDGGTRFDVRVWERDGEVALSIRPDGGSWADHGTHRVAMDGLSASGWRYGDRSIEVALPAPSATPAPRVCEFDEFRVRAAVVRRSNGASAFHVGDGYFLTAGHTFGGAITGDGWSSPVRTVGDDYVLERDVELLRASEAPDGLPALRPVAGVAVGDFVAIVTTRETARGVVTKHWTYSVQKPVRDKDGRVVWYEDRPDLDFPVLNTDMDLGIYSGSSGAPVVNECGEVVAVVSASCPNDGCAENPGVFDGAMMNLIPPWR